MIPPFLLPPVPPVTPGLPQAGQGKGGNAPGKGALPDFADWLRKEPTPVAPAQLQSEPQLPSPPQLEPQLPSPSQLEPQRASQPEPQLASQPQPELQILLGAQLPLQLQPRAPHAPHAPHARPHGPQPPSVESPRPSVPRANIDRNILENLQSSEAPHPLLDLSQLPSSAEAFANHPDPRPAAPTIPREPRIVTGGDHVDFIEIPWQLHANLGLSYIGRGRLELAILASASTAPHAAPTANSDARAVAHASGFSRADFGTRAAAALATIAAATVSESEAAAGAPALERLHARMATLLSWPHRVLRWLDGREGTTAWVRDYRADAASYPSLIESMRCAAAEQGLSLHRIMLNGREIWRADTPST